VRLRGTPGEEVEKKRNPHTHLVDRGTVISKNREVDKREEVCDWGGVRG
jgi:hypothetical protein